MEDLLRHAAERSERYLASLPERPVFPRPDALDRLSGLSGPLPDKPSDPADVLELLDEIGSPATVASAGPRYFGFVVGGVLPATLAANWLAGAWDQNAGSVVMSPVAAEVEAVAIDWLLDVLGLPVGSGVGFVTGATMANFSCLAAARHALLAREGWDVEADGLYGAPSIDVIVGDEVHTSLLKALAMLGFGRERVHRVAVDGQGRMRADALPEVDGPTLICTQAGNVNTGAIDPVGEICSAVQGTGVWVHVDGAFGLWAAASPKLAHQVTGVELADSWATDGHKWLNVPYDSGIAFVRDPQHLKSAMAVSAAYLMTSDERQPDEYTPDLSRRARGVEIWAALRSLGRRGLAEMIERNCAQAARFASELQAAGHEILNDVTLNQVLVAFGDDETTRRVIEGVQAAGTCWAGSTIWRGRTAMRISVSNWSTTDDDVTQSIAAIRQAARTVASG